MLIKSVDINNFRIIEHFVVNFNGQNTIITGNNGSGKTSILESIFYSIKGYSFKTRNVLQMVKRDTNTLRIKTEYNFNNRSLIASSVIVDRKMKNTINNIEVEIKDRVLYPLIILTGKERLLVTGAPSLRRKFVDEIIFMTDPLYADVLGKYLKSLKQRNAILRTGIQGDDIIVWENMMSKYGLILREKRQAILSVMEKKVSFFYEQIIQKEADINIIYKISGKDDLSKCFRENRKRDFKRGYSTEGPHRDDIDIIMNGLEVKQYASMGEQMALALSLKLSMAEFVKDIIKESPVFLLDDILAEIDIYRGKRFIDNIMSMGQFIITSAKELFIPYDLSIDMGDTNV